MNLESSKKFVSVSFGGAALWGTFTYFLLGANFPKLAEANATIKNIQMGAIGVTAGLLLLVIFSFIGNEALASSFRKTMMAIISFFAALGFSALAACMFFYSADGWDNAFTLYLIASLVFWVSSLVLLHIITNVKFPTKHRLIVCLVAAVALFILCYCVADARQKGLL